MLNSHMPTLSLAAIVAAPELWQPQRLQCHAVSCTPCAGSDEEDSDSGRLLLGHAPRAKKHELRKHSTGASSKWRRGEGHAGNLVCASTPPTVEEVEFEDDDNVILCDVAVC